MPVVQGVSQECNANGAQQSLTDISTDLAVLVPQHLKAIRVRRPELIEAKKLKAAPVAEV
jgi:hypothetical protein